MEDDMVMNAPDRIVYSINVEDLQTVASEEMDRELTEHEIEIIENRLGEYVDWYGAIVLALNDLKRMKNR
jgi:hypothetical protein